MIELWSTPIKAYPAIGQFGTYGTNKFLAQPVYNRDVPPYKNCK
jgi:branched-chain amino acid transport system substrate-binding protein